MNDLTEDEKFVSAVNEIFCEKIPFNRILGLRVESISFEAVKISIRMRDDLMGHYTRGMLHGGVISSLIDVAGGLSAFMGVQQRMRGDSLDARIERLGRLSTVDVRVDFLRPGTGKWFVATAWALRTGKKIAVTRIEVENDRNDLIAVGTGSYVVS